MVRPCISRLRNMDKPSSTIRVRHARSRQASQAHPLIPPMDRASVPTAPTQGESWKNAVEGLPSPPVVHEITRLALCICLQAIMIPSRILSPSAYRRLESVAALYLLVWLSRAPLDNNRYCRCHICALRYLIVRALLCFFAWRAMKAGTSCRLLGLGCLEGRSWAIWVATGFYIISCTQLMYDFLDKVWHAFVASACAFVFITCVADSS